MPQLMFKCDRCGKRKAGFEDEPGGDQYLPEGWKWSVDEGALCPDCIDGIVEEESEAIAGGDP